MEYRRKANRILGFVAMIFVTTAFLKYSYNDYFWLKLLYFVAEAVLVGSIADWFAVTALFRKPLGFSFHTEIIPRNRKIIINSIADMIQKELLSADSIIKRVHKVDFWSKITNYFDSKNGKTVLKTFAIKYIDRFINKLDIEDISKNINIFLKTNLENIDIIPYAKNFCLWGLKQEEYQKLLSKTVDDILLLVETPQSKQKIYDALETIKQQTMSNLLGGFFSKAFGGNNIVNIDEVTDSVHIQLIQRLYEIKENGSQMNLMVTNAIKEHILSLENIAVSNSEISSLKEGIIKAISVEDIIKNVVNNVRKDLKNALSEYQLGDENAVDIVADSDRSLFAYTIISQIDLLWVNIKNDENIKNNVNANIKNITVSILKAKHSIIGKIVKDTLNNFTDENLNKFIEDKAGNDLQWIRINGAIVGGTVGLLIFLFLNFLYDPIVVPAIRAIFLH